MENLETEAKQHMEKLNQSLGYHEGRLAQRDISEGVKFQIRREVNAIKFAMEWAKKALEAEGVSL